MYDFRKTLVRIQTRNVEIHNKLMCGFYSLNNTKPKRLAVQSVKSTLRETSELIIAQKKDITFSQQYLEITDHQLAALDYEIADLNSIIELKQRLNETIN